MNRPGFCAPCGLKLWLRHGPSQITLLRMCENFDYKLFRGLHEFLLTVLYLITMMQRIFQAGVLSPAVPRTLKS